MYLYLREEITSCGGQVDGFKYHLIDLSTAPAGGEERELSLRNMPGVDDFWTFLQLFDNNTLDAGMCYALSNVWEYNCRESKWECVLKKEMEPFYKRV